MAVYVSLCRMGFGVVSESKHTPGPWVADFGEAFHIREADKGRIASLVFAKGHFGFKGRRDANEVAANARLISAAPDLLEALDSFVAHYQNGINPMLDDVAIEARAAIAKAKGE